jgi:uncharacterized protein (TIGR03083 family)
MIQPILCAPLLRKVDEQLVELLSSLDPSQWDLQTVAPAWKVRDVAAHLLDTSLRKLAIVRDRQSLGPPPDDLVAFINRLNSEGVAAYRGLSPAVLIARIQAASEEFAQFHESLDPYAPAAFAVSWAGEQASLNWFDTARELTERWHHQQQIRLATHRPGIMSRELYHPVLDCFLRGLPYTFRNQDAPAGTRLLIEIEGDAGGQWTLARTGPQWELTDPAQAELTSHVSIPQELAWRVFTKGIDPAAARKRIRIEGNRALGEIVLKMTAIVA